MLQPASVEREDAPFASGDHSTVYRASFHGRPVVIKVLNIGTRSDREKLHTVGSFGPKISKRLLILYLQFLVREVITWKWLRHENVLPFVGVMFAPISIVSERMENGTIMDFIRVNQDYNRLHLVSEGRVMLFCNI